MAAGPIVGQSYLFSQRDHANSNQPAGLAARSSSSSTPSLARAAVVSMSKLYWFVRSMSASPSEVGGVTGATCNPPSDCGVDVDAGENHEATFPRTCGVGSGVDE